MKLIRRFASQNGRSFTLYYEYTVQITVKLHMILKALYKCKKQKSLYFQYSKELK